VGRLSGQQQTEVWSAVSGCGPGVRAADRWDVLAAREAARQRAAAARLGQPTDPDPPDPQAPAEPVPRELDRRIRRALG
jgi:hypothetical protein